MPVIDFILNIAGLLLWLNWRSLHFDPLLRRAPATLVGTLRPAEPQPGKGWPLLAGLGLLLLVRAILYWDLGPAVNWTPQLDLGVVALAFRSDSYPPGSSLRATLLFSLLSFLRLLLVFYFWLLVLGAIKRPSTEPEPIQKLIRLHLGRLGSWPWPAQLILPLLLAAALWVLLHPVLVGLDVINRAHSLGHLAGQAGLVSAGLLLTLKYLLPTILLLHFVLTYVYLGRSAFWDFISGTARTLLTPLRFLRLGKVDFAPLVGTVLLVALLHWLPNLLEHDLLSRNLTLWPQ